MYLTWAKSYGNKLTDYDSRGTVYLIWAKAYFHRLTGYDSRGTVYLIWAKTYCSRLTGYDSRTLSGPNHTVIDSQATTVGAQCSSFGPKHF